MPQHRLFAAVGYIRTQLLHATHDIRRFNVQLTARLEPFVPADQQGQGLRPGKMLEYMMQANLIHALRRKIQMRQVGKNIRRQPGHDRMF